MPIDYKLAAMVIDRAMKRIDYVIGNDKRPVLAFAGPGSSGSNPELYRKHDNTPTLDARVRAYYSTPEPITNIPTAREVLYRLLNF